MDADPDFFLFEPHKPDSEQIKFTGLEFWRDIDQGFHGGLQARLQCQKWRVEPNGR